MTNETSTRHNVMNRIPVRFLRAFSRKNPGGEVVSFVVAFIFGALVQCLLKKSWPAAFGREAPLNPSQPGVNWGEALAWGVVTGAAAGAVKVITRRGTDVARERLA